MKIGGSSYNVYKRLIDSTVAPIWSASVVQILFFKRKCKTKSTGSFRESVANICWQLHLGICPGCQPHAAFWRHLVQIDNNRICKKVYIECKILTGEQNQNNWASQVKQSLAECGLQYWWNESSPVMGSHTMNSSM